MADLLRAEGFALDDTELRRRQAAGDPLGRPHLAHALLDHPDNATRIAAEGIGSLKELFPRYLVPGVPTYVARTRPTVAEAIELIHAAGGVAVWAHPFWDVQEPETVRAMLERFASLGVDGVEAFYPTHTAEQVGLLARSPRSWICSRPAPPTSTAPSTRPSRASERSSCTASGPVWGRWPPRPPPPDTAPRRFGVYAVGTLRGCAYALRLGARRCGRCGRDTASGSQ